VSLEALLDAKTWSRFRGKKENGTRFGTWINYRIVLLAMELCSETLLMAASAQATLVHKSDRPTIAAASVGASSEARLAELHADGSRTLLAMVGVYLVAMFAGIMLLYYLTGPT
jgi:hypothetical protein